MTIKPDTVEGARENGRACCDAGHSIQYNPYRNTPMNDSHLHDAWVKGWEEAYKNRSHASGY